MKATSVTLSPHIAGLAPDHEMTDGARTELYDYVEEEGVPWSEDSRSTVSGAKGTATDLAVLIGTPGLVAGLVRVVHLWLSRDKARSLRLSRKLEDGKIVEIKIDGDNISEQVVRDAVQRFLNSK